MYIAQLIKKQFAITIMAIVIAIPALGYLGFRIQENLDLDLTFHHAQQDYMAADMQSTEGVRHIPVMSIKQINTYAAGVMDAGVLILSPLAMYFCKKAIDLYFERLKTGR